MRDCIANGSRGDGRRMPTVPDALKIDRGEGRFGDADGFVASQFKVDEYGDAIDNQIG